MRYARTMEPARENSGENSGATLTREDAEQIRRDLAAHGTAFVLDGRRVDPSAVRVREDWWASQPEMLDSAAPLDYWQNTDRGAL